MEIGWISAVMAGDGIDPLDDEAVILLPVAKEKITEYLRRHPEAVIDDLQDNQGCYPEILRRYGCTVFDIISRDCTLEELNTFLSAAYPLTHEQFESGLCRMLEVKWRRPDGKPGTEDMLEQARRWDEMRDYPEEGRVIKLERGFS